MIDPVLMLCTAMTVSLLMDLVVVVGTSAPTKARIEQTLPKGPRVACVTPDQALAHE